MLPFNLSPWSRDARLKKKTGVSNQLTFRGLLAHGISGKRQRARYDLTCGLQISVRIRGKKSREEDYTNQVDVVGPASLLSRWSSDWILTGTLPLLSVLLPQEHRYSDRHEVRACLRINKLCFQGYVL